MAEQSPISGAGEVLPKDALERLALFAEWTDTTPPAKIMAADGAFSADLLAYAVDTGLSLDWLTLGNEQGLVCQSYRIAREARENTVWRADLSEAAHQAQMLHGLAASLWTVNDGTKGSADMVCALSITIEEKARALALALERTNDEFGA